MENLFALFTLLSLLAFVIGMFSPQTVIPFNWKKTRGRVALIYLGLVVICGIIGSSFSENETNTTTVANKETVAENSKGGTDKRTNSKPEKNTSSQNQEIESFIGKPIEIGHFIYTVKNIGFRKTVGDDFVEETADGIYLLINLSIKNVSKETRTLDGSLFYVTDVDGTKYEYSTVGSTALEFSGKKTLFLKECQPNITTNGILIFEVPAKGEYYLHLVGSFWGTSSVRVLLK
jgi:hypothetical protein